MGRSAGLNQKPGWYFPDRTPEQFADLLRDAIGGLDKHPDQTTAERLVLVFAWNEFGEGGYIAPTKGDPDGRYRFTVNGPLNRLLPGRPDLVLPKRRTVVFVHGCFWHGHENCPAFRLPKTRRAWWKLKIHGNRARDLRHEAGLRELGWHVVTIWECALCTRSARDWLGRRLPSLLE